MLQIENEYETPKESSFYQNNHDNIQNPDIVQNKETILNKNLKKVHAQRTYIITHKIQLTKERIWTKPLLLESPKSKDFSITRPRN